MNAIYPHFLGNVMLGSEMRTTFKHFHDLNGCIIYALSKVSFILADTKWLNFVNFPLQIFLLFYRLALVLGIEKVGEFVLEHAVDKNTSKIKRKVKLVLSEKIKWPGDGTAPRDSPKCGFEGEKCLSDPQQKEDKGEAKFLVYFSCK